MHHLHVTFYTIDKMADKSLLISDEKSETSLMSKLLMDISNEIDIKRDNIIHESNESFIDRKFDEVTILNIDVKLEKFKEEMKDLVTEIMHKEMKKVRNDSFIATDDEKSNTEKFLLTENQFLKEELKYKNHIISTLLELQRSHLNFSSPVINKTVNESILIDTPKSVHNKDKNVVRNDNPNGNKINLNSIASDITRKRDDRKNHETKDEKISTKKQIINNVNCEKNENIKSEKKKRNIVIIGDSIIKNINGRGLSRFDSVTVRSHSGATTEDMVDYVKPVARKSPDAIILHVGTNDMTNNINTNKKIKNVVKAIQEHHKDVKIAISGLVYRDQYNDEIKQVNERLKNYCDSKGFTYIDNDVNIDASCLNRSKLHLNKKGDSCLARNFIDYIRNL